MAGSDYKPGIQDLFKQAVQALRKFAYSYPLSAPTIPATLAAGHRPRIGLALGGGFARGLAHIGVLKVLIENNIPIDAIAGASVGSIVGAAYASGCTVAEMAHEARAARWRDIGRWTIPRLGFATNARLEAMLRRTLHCRRFEDLKIPLAVVAIDVSTGQPVTFREGELIPPLRASCSFPGLFVPFKYQGRMLVDGAIVGSVPVAAVQEMRVDAVVAVGLKTGNPRHTPTNFFQVVGQAFQIAASQNQSIWRTGCDVIIEPEVSEFNWDDFARADDLIAAGETAAREALPALRALFQPAPVLLVPRPVPAR